MKREVLALMAEGRSNAAIAATLVVGEGAARFVRYHERVRAAVTVGPQLHHGQ